MHDVYEIFTDDCRLTRGNVQVVLEFIGEGWHGDYNADDPLDDELARLSVYRRVAGEWQECDDASYCTALPWKAINKDRDSKGLTHRLLCQIMNEVYDEALQNECKRTCERLSWLDEDDLLQLA